MPWPFSRKDKQQKQQQAEQSLRAQEQQAYQQQQAYHAYQQQQQAMHSGRAGQGGGARRRELSVPNRRYPQQDDGQYAGARFRRNSSVEEYHGTGRSGYPPNSSPCVRQKLDMDFTQEGLEVKGRGGGAVRMRPNAIDVVGKNGEVVTVTKNGGGACGCTSACTNSCGCCKGGGCCGGTYTTTTTTECFPCSGGAAHYSCSGGNHSCGMQTCGMSHGCGQVCVSPPPAIMASPPMPAIMAPPMQMVGGGVVNQTSVVPVVTETVANYPVHTHSVQNVPVTTTHAFGPPQVSMTGMMSLGPPTVNFRPGPPTMNFPPGPPPAVAPFPLPASGMMQNMGGVPVVIPVNRRR